MTGWFDDDWLMSDWSVSSRSADTLELRSTGSPLPVLIRVIVRVSSPTRARSEEARWRRAHHQRRLCRGWLPGFVRASVAAARPGASRSAPVHAPSPARLPSRRPRLPIPSWTSTRPAADRSRCWTRRGGTRTSPRGCVTRARTPRRRDARGSSCCWASSRPIAPTPSAPPNSSATNAHPTTPRGTERGRATTRRTSRRFPKTACPKAKAPPCWTWWTRRSGSYAGEAWTTCSRASRLAKTQSRRSSSTPSRPRLTTSGPRTIERSTHATPATMRAQRRR